MAYDRIKNPMNTSISSIRIGNYVVGSVVSRRLDDARRDAVQGAANALAVNAIYSGVAYRTRYKSVLPMVASEK